MIIPLLSTVIENKNETSNLFNQISNLLLNFFNKNPTLNNMLIIYFSIIISQLLFTLVSSFAQSVIINNFSYELKNSLYRSIIYTKWDYILDKSVHEHSNQILNDANRTAACLRILLQIFKSSFLVFFYTSVAVINSPKLILLIIFIATFLFLITTPLAGKSKKIGQDLTLSNESMLSKVQDSFLNFKLIKIFSNENTILGKVRDTFKTNKKIYIRADFLQEFIQFFLSFWGVLSLCIILWAAQEYFYEDSIVLIVTLYLYLRIYNQLSNIYQNYNSFLMSFDGFSNYMNEYKQTIKNKESNLYNTRNNIGNISPSIEFKNIDLSYGDNNVHKNFCLKIKKNQCVGIFGKSGSGKSTLVDLILGLIRPQNGSILINNKELNKINLNLWRKHVGYVTQYTYLVDGTIEENINFSNQKIEKKKFLEILISVGANEFIKNKKKGIKSLINNRSIKLSGGERQRLGIARALLGEKNLLIFDEPTSSLDSVNEKKILSIIKNLKGKKTIILISHNKNALNFCDKIIKI